MFDVDAIYILSLLDYFIADAATQAKAVALLRQKNPTTEVYHQDQRNPINDL